MLRPVTSAAYLSLTLLTSRSSAFHLQSLPFAERSVSRLMSSSSAFTIPDQPARFARAQKENNQRYLDITTVYDPSVLKNKRVAVTGANRGIGLALAKELTEVGANLVAIVRTSSDELDALNPAEVVTGIDVTSDEKCESLKSKISGGPIDIVSFVLWANSVSDTLSLSIMPDTSKWSERLLTTWTLPTS